MLLCILKADGGLPGMPENTAITENLFIGSSPINVGQAADFFDAKRYSIYGFVTGNLTGIRKQGGC